MHAATGAIVAAVALVSLAAPWAGAEWLEPDPSYKEAQLLLRLAVRDTVGHPDDPARLDSLGVALLQLGRLSEAAPALRRALALDPRDVAAKAGLGKLALFDGRLGEAESLLAQVPGEPGAIADLYATRLRQGDWAAAARMAETAQDQGRVPLLEAMEQAPVYEISGAKDEVIVPWSRIYPTPLIRVKLNGQSVLMAIDTGCKDVLLDASIAKRCKVTELAGERLEFWMGSRVAVKNAMVQRLELGGIKVGRLPAGTLSLRKWTIEVNPQSEPVAGVIGLELLRRFTPTLDYGEARLELRPRGAARTATGAQRVPFQVWGAMELTVWGSISGGRKMALVVETGVPGCGVGAPQAVFDELGIKAGTMSRIVKGAGSWLSGRPWYQVTVPTVTVGPVVADKVAGWSGALDPVELWRHGVRRDGLLSHDFFRGKRVTIDWEMRDLVFEP